MDKNEILHQMDELQAYINSNFKRIPPHSSLKVVEDNTIKDQNEIDKLLPYPFNSCNWVFYFGSKYPIVNPYTLELLSSMVDYKFDIKEIFSNKFLTEFQKHIIHPAIPIMNIKLEILWKLAEYFPDDFYKVDELTDGHIYLGSYESDIAVLISNKSIDDDISVRFFRYYEQFSYYLFSNKIQHYHGSYLQSNPDFKIPNDIIYWHFDEDFLYQALVNDSEFLNKQKKLRQKKRFF